MSRTTSYARVGATAIAALALCSTAEAAVKPIVDLSLGTTKTGSAQTAPAKTSTMPDERTMEFGAGGALALLVVGGGAWALSRRRRRLDEEAWGTEVEAENSAQPPPQHDAPITDQRSAFAWGNAPATAQEPSTSGRRSGESWVERAYRGPSPENPSLSLRKRLKRAAFFDKREREAAAGDAMPVEADAGLPELMTEPVHKRARELEAA
jgi:hypothetical protein